MAVEERETPFSLHGDVLEAVVSHVPTIDLLPASHVSPTWRRAVVSSLRRSPRLKPWLILRLLSRREPYASVAYDPHSRSWVPLPFPHAPLTCPLRSSHPRLLFTLSPSKLSISPHPFAATWRDLDPPRVWRHDPVVALVGSRVVVAGGTCDFEDAACAVEVYDLDIGRWESCEPLPEEFSQSSSATWLSVATSDKRMYILEKSSGRFSWFEPVTGRWARTCELRPDPAVHRSAIGFSGDRLILAGLSGGVPDPISLTLWEVNPNPNPKYKEIAKMPTVMVERLVGEGFGSPSIGFSTVGDFGYFYNATDFGEAFFCEFGKGRWESIGRPKEVDEDPTARIVSGCWAVGMDDIKVLPRRGV